MANSPEFQAFSRAKSDLVRQLSFTLTLLKNDCRSSVPQLLSFDEDQEIFGSHGSNAVQETSKLLDVVLTRIRLNPVAYYTFRDLRVLSDGANQSLTLLMDRLLAEEKQKQVKTEPVAQAGGAEPPAVHGYPDRLLAEAKQKQVRTQPVTRGVRAVPPISHGRLRPSSQPPTIAQDDQVPSQNPACVVPVSQLKTGENPQEKRSWFSWKYCTITCVTVPIALLFMGGGVTLIVIGCLGLNGEETCDDRDFENLVDDKGNEYPDIAPPYMFDVYNLFVGLVCFGAPVIPCGVVAMVMVYGSLTEARRRQLRPVAFCFSIIIGSFVVVYIVLALTVPFYSVVALMEASDVLSMIQDDSVAEEVCSPLSLYAALVMSSVVVGVFALVLYGLPLLALFVGACFWAIKGTYELLTA